MNTLRVLIFCASLALAACYVQLDCPPYVTQDDGGIACSAEITTPTALPYAAVNFFSNPQLECIGCYKTLPNVAKPRNYVNFALNKTFTGNVQVRAYYFDTNGTVFSSASSYVQVRASPIISVSCPYSVVAGQNITCTTTAFSPKVRVTEVEIGGRRGPISNCIGCEKTFSTAATTYTATAIIPSSPSDVGYLLNLRIVWYDANGNSYQHFASVGFTSA